MEEIIHTLNGLHLTALYLNTIAAEMGNNGKIWKIFYCQDRIVECDNDNNEIKSHDLLVMLCTSHTNHKQRVEFEQNEERRTFDELGDSDAKTALLPGEF